MTEPNPTVSVITPTHNRAGLIARAIQSVLDQTYPQFDLLVVDDASTDKTEDVVGTFGDPRIRYVRHPETKGAAAARNTGLDLSQGDYVAFLDSDDEWLPIKLERQLSIIRQVPSDVGLIYSDFLWVYPDGRQRRHQPVAQGCSLGYPSRWLVKREVFEQVGGFDEGMPSMQDTEISIRIQKGWLTHHDPTVVMRYHVTAGSVCRNAENARAGTATLIERYADVVTKDELSYWYLLLGKSCMTKGRVAEARRALIRAVLTCPFKLRHYPALAASLLGRRSYSLLRGLKHVGPPENGK